MRSYENGIARKKNKKTTQEQVHRHGDRWYKVTRTVFEKFKRSEKLEKDNPSLEQAE